MVPLVSDGQLHVRRFISPTPEGDLPEGLPVALLVHGLAEDGTIFYSRTGGGLANFLAEQGFDVYVPDLRGKGRSWPEIKQLKGYRLIHAVTEDLPAIIEAIQARTTSSQQYWFGHGIGGVLLSSVLARYPEFASQTAAAVYFGSSRTVREREVMPRGASRAVALNALDSLALQFARVRGSIPSSWLDIGASDEHENLQKDLLEWFAGQPWSDPADGYHYGRTLSSKQLQPPTLYFASAEEAGYGCTQDVVDFMCEIGKHDGRTITLGEKQGNRHNYSHISMLTHQDAWRDHFPFMLDWLLEIQARYSCNYPWQPNLTESTERRAVTNAAGLTDPACVD